jgi:protein TonB
MSGPRGRHTKAGIPIGRTLAIVAGIHALLGGGVFLIAQTEAGQKLIKEYKVSLGPKEEKREPPKKEPPKPPPEQPKQALQAPLPQVAAAPAPSSGPAPQIGGGGSGLVYGGKFAPPSGSGGVAGAFNGSVERRFRQYYKEPHESFGTAQLDLRVGGRGEVLSYQLARSSGNASNDASILAAAAELQKVGVIAPPKGRERLVQVKVTPY